MLVPFETVDVPRVPDLSSYEEFRRAASLKIPAFVVEKATGVGAADMAPLGELLAELNLEAVPAIGGFAVGHRKAYEDPKTGAPYTRVFPLGDFHMDAEGPVKNLVELNMHFVEEGHGVASFFELTSERLSSGYGADDMWHEYHSDLTTWFHAGLVPSETLVPVRYRAPFRRGNLVVFRRGGESPTAHIFITNSKRRKGRLGRLRSTAPITES